MNTNNNELLVKFTKEVVQVLINNSTDEIKKKKILNKILEAIKNPEIINELLLAIELDKDTHINGFTFSSSKYDAFKILPGNRQLNTANLRKLDSSISTHGYRSSQPITLNNVGQILNGQHRAAICKAKNIPIFFNFERTHSNSLALTVDMNISQKNWVLEDYVRSYADRGFQDYINLLTLVKDQGISISLALWLIYHSRNGFIQETVKTGSLRCSDRDMEVVIKTLDLIKELRDVIPDNFADEKSLKNAFLGDKVAVPLAVIIDQKNYNHSRMIKQIKNYYKSIDKRNMSTCGDSLVKLYNYRLKDSSSRLIDYSDMVRE